MYSLFAQPKDFLFCVATESPVVSVSQSVVENTVGTTVVLNCTATGDPLPIVHWLVLPSMTVLPSSDYPNYVRLRV